MKAVFDAIKAAWPFASYASCHMPSDAL